MKVTFTLFFAWGLFLAGQAQVHVVKLDLPRLLFNSAHLNYEYVLNGHWTIGGSLNAQLPLNVTKGIAGSITQSLNNRWEVGHFTGGRVSGFDLTPEVRYYTAQKSWNKKGAPQGLYGSAFLRFSNYSWDLPFEWYDDKIHHQVRVDSDIQMNALGVGIGLGHQWIIRDKITLDVNFMGIGLAKAWGQGTLNILDSPELDSERAAQIARHMAEDIDVGINDKVPFASWYDLKLESEGKEVRGKGGFPLPILRMGIALGIPL